MREQPYKNREIDAMFIGLKRELLDEEVGILPRIEIQVKKTNGRVNWLERIAWVLTTAVIILTVSGNANLSNLVHLLISIL